MMNKRKAELLAPAGSFDSLKAAVAAGADAIYMGGSRFGARAYARMPQDRKWWKQSGMPIFMVVVCI